MSTIKNEGKNTVQQSSTAFSGTSNSSNLNATMNEQIFGTDQFKDENKEMNNLGIEAKNDGPLGKVPTAEIKRQYEEQEEVDKSGMEALNDETPKRFGLFHRMNAPSKLNFQDESENEAMIDEQVEEPKFNWKYAVWG